MVPGPEVWGGGGWCDGSLLVSAVSGCVLSSSVTTWRRSTAAGRDVVLTTHLALPVVIIITQLTHTSITGGEEIIGDNHL